MADDGNNADRFTIGHMEEADSLADHLNRDHPELMIHKLYYDAYKRIRQLEVIRMCGLICKSS